MMHYWEEKSHAQDLRRKAHEMMDANGISPTPVNYELCFFYELGQNRNLQDALNKAIEDGHVSDIAQTKALHQRLFGPSAEKEVSDASARLADELKQMASVLGTTVTGSTDYGRALTAAAAQLTQTDVSPQVRGIIDSVTSATLAMAETNKRLEAQVESSSKEVEALQLKMTAIRKESLQDALTGLANRRCFDEQIAAAIAKANADRSPLCVLMCDIDHFKKFNDTWGHATGDQVLRLVAHCVSSNVKGRDTAARYGGEELVIVLPQTSLADALTVAEQIRRTVESRKIVKKSTGDSLGSITLSIGASQYISGEDVGEFVGRADACLYVAKRTGRNRVNAVIPAETKSLESAAASDSAHAGQQSQSGGSVLELEFRDHGTEILVDPEVTLVDERLKRLHNWWLKAGSGALPRWEDRMLEELAFVGDTLHLHEVCDDGARFRVRHMGPGLMRILGQDLTGNSFSSEPAKHISLVPTVARAFEVVKLTYQMKAPLRTFSKSSHEIQGRRFKGESLCLPLSEKGTTIDLMLMATMLTPVAAVAEEETPPTSAVRGELRAAS